MSSTLTGDLTGFDNAKEILVEILHGEGGLDSKDFTFLLRDIYESYAANLGLKVERLTEDEGHHLLKVSGVGAGKAFALESGKHCVQRIPPNDKSGRKQTSFANVAVLPMPPENSKSLLQERELEISYQTGKQKAGGQNVNKVASAVRMRHIPTGLSVFINGRDQGQNRRLALRILSARVNEQKNSLARNAYSREKSRHLGDRGRGGKIRTYNFLKSFATDHRTGKTTKNMKAILRGELSLLL